ncbi:MAG: cytochrome c [Betaproteobacteria bacterium]|nr:cytochrome c [Betaproteobacteria bacterium]
MGRGFILGVVVTVVLAIAASYLALISGRIPTNADAKPGALELWAAGTARHATIRRNAPKEPDPVPLTDANLIAGIRLYGEHCALCHGTAKGETSPSTVGEGLYPRAPQLATDGVEDDPPGVSYWKIKHGIRLTGMPSWRYTLNDRQIWTLALFLKHMDHLPPAAQHAWAQVKS